MANQQEVLISILSVPLENVLFITVFFWFALKVSVLASAAWWAAGHAVGTVDGADGEGAAREGRGMAGGSCALVCIVPLQTKSRFRASDTDPTWVKSFPTICSVLEMLMLLLIPLVHLKNF